MSTIGRTNEFKVRGLFTSGAEETFNFCKIVEAEAKKRGKVFFIADAEGHESLIGDVCAENMSGWLVPEGEADRFEALWRTDIETVWDSKSRFFAWERWFQDEEGNIQIEFDCR